MQKQVEHFELAVEAPLMGTLTYATHEIKAFVEAEKATAKQLSFDSIVEMAEGKTTHVANTTGGKTDHDSSTTEEKIDHSSKRAEGKTAPNLKANLNQKTKGGAKKKSPPLQLNVHQLVRGTSVQVPLGRRQKVKAVIIQKGECDTDDHDALNHDAGECSADNRDANKRNAVERDTNECNANNRDALTPPHPTAHKANPHPQSRTHLTAPKKDIHKKKAHQKETHPKETSKEGGKAKYKIKAISQINNERPILIEEHLQWLEWLAQYYVHPIGQVVQMAFAPLAKKKNQPTLNATHQQLSLIDTHTKSEGHKIQLNPTQQKCVDEILKPQGFRVHLLQGVTGSGKTEVYLNLFEHCLQQGQQGLMLTPEIALTPQLVKKFTQRFGDQVAVVHSQMTAREKTNQWWDVVDKRRQILIGVRSALFCPIPQLGLIVVDEEHEASFKQDTKLKYQARDAAIMLAKKRNLPIVLGSATPSLETLHNAQQGRYLWHKMPHRIGNNKLPYVEVVDLSKPTGTTTAGGIPASTHWPMASAPSTGSTAIGLSLTGGQSYGGQVHGSQVHGGQALTGHPFWLTPVLHNHMQACLQRHEQVALLLNRRGLARQQLCQSCSEVMGCPNCDISLTLHAKHYLVCHYCEYSRKRLNKCPHCGSAKLISLGLGTEGVERDVKALFPAARVMRADRDEITNRKQLENLISKMENREVDILVGTQMIAKGLDFEHLSLVGLVLADTSFHFPDFRSSERAFQLMVQMSGRAGRKKPGHVVIQAYNPLHPSVVCAQQHDYFAFAQQELQARQELNYPPFGRLCTLSLEGRRDEATHQVAEQLKQKIIQLQKAWPQVQALGPAPAPIFKLCNKYRYRMLLKCVKPQVLSAFCQILWGEYKKIPARSTKLQINIDPQGD